MAFESSTIGPSFIPKKPLVVRPDSRRSIGILFPLSLFAFIASLLAFGAAYLYKNRLDMQLESQKATIARQEQQFEPELLLELQRLSDRLQVSRELIAQHLTLIPLFQFLSDETIRGVQYVDFSYDTKGESGSPKIEMRGEAADYDAIALQSDVFGRNPKVKEFLFSGLDLQRGGTVAFTLSLSLDPRMFLHAEKLRSLQTQ